MKRYLFLHATLLASTFTLTTNPLSAQSTTDPIKVGVLHSLSGTMAISETSLKDVALMTFEEINNAGGVAWKKDRAGGSRSGVQLATVC
jgi:urea transport system substrate-binding protein